MRYPAALPAAGSLGASLRDIRPYGPTESRRSPAHPEQDDQAHGACGPGLGCQQRGQPALQQAQCEADRAADQGSEDQ